MDTIVTIVSYLSVSLIFLIGIAIWGRNTRKRDAIAFNQFYNALQVALENNNDQQVIENARLLMWNKWIEKKHFLPVLKFIESKSERSLELDEFHQELNIYFSEKGWFL